MKGEPKPADTIALFNDQLMKIAHCQILRKDMQVLHILKLQFHSII